jgi:hypothetical protein
MRTKTDILTEFALFSLGTGGIGSWLTSEWRQDIFDRLAEIEDQPLSAVQLNQLLVLGHEALVFAITGFRRLIHIPTTFVTSPIFLNIGLHRLRSSRWRI